MHVIFRESHGLEETAQPIDLQQTPADMVVLSFSDSDLGAFSVGWHNAKKICQAFVWQIWLRCNIRFQLIPILNKRFVMQKLFWCG